MKMIVCVAKNGGILFNNRRLSRDKEVSADILCLSKGFTLYANPYSETIFPKDSSVVYIEDFPENAKKDDYIFCEKLIEDIDYKNIDEIIIYHWNRNYPADDYFKMPKGYVLIDTTEFIGNSHNSITRERFERVLSF